MSYKLFIPGPVAVSEKTRQAMTQWIMGHRSSEFIKLYKSVQEGLQTLFVTQDPVYLSTSSAWGTMEASIRNVTQKRVLSVMNGAFSDKWFDVARDCGLPTGTLQYEWGQAIDPEDVRRELATGKYDTLTLVHSETSTGTMSPLKDIMAVVREFPEVISIVDTVSSFSALAIPKDELGIDIMLTAAQKALACPPGLALFSVSQRALERAKTTPNRGFYFDFLEFHRNWEGNMTVTTPVIPLIYALQSKLEDIFEEGVEARYARHAKLNAMMRDWGQRHGLPLLPQPEFGAVSLNCFRNELKIDLPALRNALKERFKVDIDGGYGKLKGKTFRISNMGDETEATINTLIDQLDATLPEFVGKGE